MGTTPLGWVASTVYKGGQFSLGFMLRLAIPGPSLHGTLCRTCAEFLWTTWADAREICSKTNNEKLLSSMASRSSSGSGKRHGYIDLDAPNLSSEDLWNTRSVLAALIPSSGSNGSKKPKKARNPNCPGKEYADAAQEIVLHYYKMRSLEMLHWEFLDGGVAGFVNLCVDIGREIMDKLEQTELYNNWADYSEHIQWLDELVTRNTTNVVLGTFEVIHKKILGQGYNSELEDLLQKLKVVEAFCQRYLGQRNKGIPWKESILKLAFEQHLQGGVVWLPEKVKIVEMLGDRAEGGYGEVRRVRIARMAGIPTNCDFVAKKSKAATPLLQRQAQCMEACVNPIQHPGIIKFWAVHHKSME